MSTPIPADISPALGNLPVWSVGAPFQDRAPPHEEKILVVESKLSGIRIIEIKKRKSSH